MSLEKLSRRQLISMAEDFKVLCTGNNQTIIARIRKNIENPDELAAEILAEANPVEKPKEVAPKARGHFDELPGIFKPKKAKDLGALAQHAFTEYVTAHSRPPEHVFTTRELVVLFNEAINSGHDMNLALKNGRFIMGLPLEIDETLEGKVGIFR